MFCSYKMHQVYSWCNHSEEGPTETWNTILMVLEQAIIIFPILPHIFKSDQEIRKIDNFIHLGTTKQKFKMKLFNIQNM